MNEVADVNIIEVTEVLIVVLRVVVAPAYDNCESKKLNSVLSLVS